MKKQRAWMCAKSPNHMPGSLTGKRGKPEVVSSTIEAVHLEDVFAGLHAWSSHQGLPDRRQNHICSSRFPAGDVPLAEYDGRNRQMHFVDQTGR
jgi:hypothetical protein